MEEIKELRKECYRLIDLIVKKGEIKKPDLFIALAIRLRLPINNCFIKDFDENMCKKAIKELKYMLEI
jgi:hypothetical protein